MNIKFFLSKHAYLLKRYCGESPLVRFILRQEVKLREAMTSEQKTSTNNYCKRIITSKRKVPKL